MVSAIGPSTFTLVHTLFPRKLPIADKGTLIIIIIIHFFYQKLIEIPVMNMTNSQLSSKYKNKHKEEESASIWERLELYGK